ncbi:MAG: hypothetical protein M1826_001927 [Phylliscum demangeonii]|nr:MAG: hypothetical protein M1826_001927 [Phylliscum demangeonii]
MVGVRLLFVATVLTGLAVGCGIPSLEPRGIGRRATDGRRLEQHDQTRWDGLTTIPSDVVQLPEASDGVERGADSGRENGRLDGGAAPASRRRLWPRKPGEDVPPASGNDDAIPESGEPTLAEMKQNLPDKEYQRYLKVWDRGKAFRRMERAVKRGYKMTAKEARQYARDHQAHNQAEQMQWDVRKQLIAAEKARPYMKELREQSSQRKNDAARARRDRFRELKELKRQRPLTESEEAEYDKHLARAKQESQNSIKSYNKGRDAYRANVEKYTAIEKTRALTNQEREAYSDVLAQERRRLDGLADKNREYRERKKAKKAAEKEAQQQSNSDSVLDILHRHPQSLNGKQPPPPSHSTGEPPDHGNALNGKQPQPQPHADADPSTATPEPVEPQPPPKRAPAMSRFRLRLRRLHTSLLKQMGRTWRGLEQAGLWPVHAASGAAREEALPRARIPLGGESLK